MNWVKGKKDLMKAGIVDPVKLPDWLWKMQFQSLQP